MTEANAKDGLGRLILHQRFEIVDRLAAEFGIAGSVGNEHAIDVRGPTQ